MNTPALSSIRVRLLLLAACLVLSASQVAAQGAAPAAAQTGAIAGTVRASGGPVAGAHVSTEPGSRAATTTRDGTFRFDGVPAGSRVLQVSAPGYAPSS